MLEGGARQPPRYPSHPSTVESEVMDETRPSTPSSVRTHRSPMLSLHSPSASLRVVSLSSPGAFFGTEALGDTSLDTFTRYFASDQIAAMNSADAADLVNTLQDSQWSGKFPFFSFTHSKRDLIVILHILQSCYATESKAKSFFIVLSADLNSYCKYV